MRILEITITVIDFDNCGAQEIKDIIENTKYPNRCILPTVEHIEERDLGEWSDDHPLNHENTRKEALFNLFG